MSEDLFIYGTPFPSIENDNKKFVPVWNQKAVGPTGGKRFHGAFEGGFSAGYFNTVGSKEGWKPSQFVSSRTQKHSSASGDVESYMDKEDLKVRPENPLSIFLTIKDHGTTAVVAVYESKSREMGEKPKQDNKINENLEKSSHIYEYLRKYLRQGTVAKEGFSKSIHSTPFSGVSTAEENIYSSIPDVYQNNYQSLSESVLKADSIPHEQMELIELAFGNTITLTESFEFPSPSVPLDFVPFKHVHTPSTDGLNSGRRPFIEPAIGSSASPSASFLKLDDVDEKTASSALKGFVPFAEDPDKQDRYTRYLRWCINQSKPASGRESSMFIDEKERDEFIMSAQIFKPVSSVMAARFESSTSLHPSTPSLRPGLSRPEPKSDFNNSTPSSTSARKTSEPRMTYLWIPANLLCKRFNVDPPDTESLGSVANQSNVKGVLQSEAAELFLSKFSTELRKEYTPEDSEKHLPHNSELPAVDEKASSMPDIGLFEAIFGTEEEVSSSSKQGSHRSKAVDYFD